jgi:hypothetical protein
VWTRQAGVRRRGEGKSRCVTVWKRGYDTSCGKEESAGGKEEAACGVAGVGVRSQYAAATRVRVSMERTCHCLEEQGQFV